MIIGKNVCRCCVVLLMLLTANMSFASVIQSNTSQDTAPSLPSNDLVLAGSGNVSSVYGHGGALAFGTTWVADNNGTINAGGAISEIIACDGTGGNPPWQVFMLDITTNQFGYDVTEILSYSNWADDRTDQAIEIRYAIVGDTLDGVSELTRVLGTYTYDADASSSYTIISLTDDSGDILSGITAIEIKYVDGLGNNNATAYTEFAVIGTPAVPEPATMILLGAGGCVALVRRKK